MSYIHATLPKNLTQLGNVNAVYDAPVKEDDDVLMYNLSAATNFVITCDKARSSIDHKSKLAEEKGNLC